MFTIFRSTQIKHLCWSLPIFSSIYFTASYFSFSVVEWAMSTEENWLPLCSRTHFCDRLLLSMNSLQSLGSYCGTPSLSRSCAISSQYAKSITVEKKGGTLDAYCGRSWCEHCQRVFFSFNLDANSSAESVDNQRSRTRSFNSLWENGCGASSSRTNFLFIFMSFNTGGIFITNVRKFSEDRLWNFNTISYRKTCWLKIRILETAPVLSVDPSHINSAEVAVSDMVCWLPLNHRNSKVQTPLAIRLPTQSLGACLAHRVWCPSFILVSKFNTKISMVSTRYETCDWLPIRSNDVFSTYVVEHVGLISARSSRRSHLIHLPNKNRYKLVINWCHCSPLRSVYGTTSTTTQIFRNTHKVKTPVHAHVEFPIYFLGRLPH